MNDWSACKNLLVIRADNMGDLLLSSPAIHVLKEQLSCKITALISTKAQGIVPMLPDIDEVLVCDVPWVKLEDNNNPDEFFTLLSLIKEHSFDACVVFTVYSQNPMPAILLAYLAEIPLRLAYCRENPYHLLSDWLPDPEPFQCIKHQVRRDLDLVASVLNMKRPFQKEAHFIPDQPLSIDLPEAAFGCAQQKIHALIPDITQSAYFILHPGVSELKRRYPLDGWISVAKALLREYQLPLLITGSAAEKAIACKIASATGGNCFSVASLLQVDEFAALIAQAKAVISVNTGTVHLAAAVQTPVVVLHAQTNPQHSPWMVSNRVLEYSVPEHLKSNNQVIRWVDRLLYQQHLPYPTAKEILAALKEII
jgi:ADP-heptose:LPS heptosyltransferase